MLRKHILTTPSDKLNQLPFHSWNCITLQLEHRDVDLVIKSEKQMEIFLQFLVYKLKTLDGRRNTSTHLLEYLNQQDIQTFMKKNKRVEISGARELQIMQKNEMKLFTKVCQKYTILKVRNKISFIAFQKGYTIQELFLRTILKSYQKLQAERVIPSNAETEKRYDKIISLISMQDVSFLKLLVVEKAKLDPRVSAFRDIIIRA